MPPSPMPPRFFEGKNEKQAADAHRAGALALPLRADRLRRVLEHVDAARVAQGADRGHVGALAEQVHRARRPSSWP